MFEILRHPTTHQHDGPLDHLHPPNALYDSENLSRKVAKNIIKKHLEIYCMFFVDLRLFKM